MKRHHSSAVSQSSLTAAKTASRRKAAGAYESGSPQPRNQPLVDSSPVCENKHPSSSPATTSNMVC